MQTGFAHFAEGIQAVILRARGYDFAVELGCRIEVVVVVVEPRVLQLLGLAFFQHAERRAGFHAEPAHRLDHLNHAIKIALLGTAPRGAHAKARCAFFFRGPCRGDYRVERKHRLVVYTGVIPRGLRAVTAIFRTAAGLDRQQRRQLDRVRVEIFAMHDLRAMQQIVERQVQQLRNLVDAPARRRAVVGSYRGRRVVGKGIHGVGLADEQVNL